MVRPNKVLFSDPHYRLHNGPELGFTKANKLNAALMNHSHTYDFMNKLSFDFGVIYKLMMITILKIVLCSIRVIFHNFIQK